MDVRFGDAEFRRVLQESTVFETGGSLRLVALDDGSVLIAFDTNKGVAKYRTTVEVLRSALNVISGAPDADYDIDGTAAPSDTDEAQEEPLPR